MNIIYILVIDLIAERIGGKWFDLSYAIGLPDARVDEIEKEFRADTKGRTYEVYNNWDSNLKPH
jgi:hypothetical protein